MALSDLIIRQARATGKTYNLPDSDGLGLVVSPVGGKSWHFRYYWQSKQKRISLGGYPEIGLRKARDLRNEARALLAKGINLHIARNQKRRAARLAAEHSFNHVYQLWLDHRRRELREGRQSTLSQIQHNFALAEAIKSLPNDSGREEDVMFRAKRGCDANLVVMIDSQIPADNLIV